ncbi:hypothetical protein AVEN_271242-1 [Araneus ventricosus]|uniref:Reverse transcriptase domain-containing protein n=1 Tax=Araneus ventricosus TaxID=182803 RepID=A0A4Y2G1E3_ARAVE|nr:hypothetical protein AVEN_271242-1 [Araneus ventricosus]
MWSETEKFNPHSSQTTEDQVPLLNSVKENKCELRKELKDIIQNYDSIFEKDKSDFGEVRVELQRIAPNSDFPDSLRHYRTSPIEKQEIYRQVEKSLQAGLIKWSNNTYSSPVILAFKRDECRNTRLYIDFRKLNTICRSECKPLPLMDSLFINYQKEKFFSSLDLASGYCHVPIHPKVYINVDFCKTFILYDWFRLPFGIKVSPVILKIKFAKY